MKFPRGLFGRLTVGADKAPPPEIDDSAPEAEGLGPDEGWLLIVPVPSLVSTLLAREQEKGSPLTEAEVLEIRDHAPSIAMPAYARDKVVEERGYDDIDPENVWAEWLEARRVHFELDPE